MCLTKQGDRFLHLTFNFSKVTKNFFDSLICIPFNIFQIVSWPDHEEQQEISVQFQLQSQLPNIIGALDGTHIRLTGSIDGDKDYINRKGFPSVQLQVFICRTHIYLLIDTQLYPLILKAYNLIKTNL